MKIEHFALNVADPDRMAQWYCLNMGMKVVSRFERHPFTHFLGDDSGDVMIEIYNNPPESVPDYKNMDPLICHLAFVSDQPDVDRVRLENAGATFVSEVKLPDSTHLIMMRDPWGLAIQLCKRALPMLKFQV